MKAAMVASTVLLGIGVCHSRPPLDPDVRSRAGKLARSWVDTASPNTLDSLAHRSIAFAGMVSGLEITLDGKRLPASKLLTDSAVTILGNGTIEADAAAVRNIVHALMLISRSPRTGRTSRFRAPLR